MEWALLTLPAFTPINPFIKIWLRWAMWRKCMADNWPLYNLLDGATTRKIWYAIGPDMIKQGYEPPYNQTIDLLPVLVYMMNKGIKVNTGGIADAHEEVRDLILEKRQQLTKMCGYELNPGSPKECQKYFYIILGLIPYKHPKTGAITCDDKALARIARKGHKEASLIQEIRRLEKLEDYFSVVVDPDGRIRCSWNPRGTREGRLSSSKTVFGTGMNLQNVHPIFKKYMVADEGKILIEIDKSYAEWIVTAFVSGDARMIEVAENKEDPHIITAGHMTNLPEELLIKEDKLIGQQTDPNIIEELRLESLKEIFTHGGFIPRTMSCRQAGKKSNHGCNYREGFRTFALKNEMPESDAKLIVEAYSGEVYVGLPIWWKSTEVKLGKDHRTLTNCFGRKRRFLHPWGDDLFRAAIAYIPQSTVVDLLNKGMIKTFNNQDSYMYMVDLLAQIHDSLLLQYPINCWGDLAKAIQQIRDYLNPVMKYGGREFQIETDFKIGLNWGDTSNDNPQGMIGVPLHENVTELADALEETYGEITP